MSRLVQVTPFALAPNSGVVPGWLRGRFCIEGLCFNFGTRRAARSNNPSYPAFLRRFDLTGKAQTPHFLTRLTDSS